MIIAPCKKCGSEAKFKSDHMIDTIICSNANCGMKTNPYFDGAEYAISEWNKINKLDSK